MTEEQAKFLYSIADCMGTTGIEYFTCKDGDKMREIINILEQESKTDGDCISRAEAIRLFEQRFIELQKAHQQDKQLGVNWCINTIKDMPSVTPTHGTCKDCKNWNEYENNKIIGVCEEFSSTRDTHYTTDFFYCADFEKRGCENE